VAKGLTNGAVPMGAVFARQNVHDAFMTGSENLIEFFHGYIYSAHPLACAAGLATLDTYAEEGLLTRAAKMADYFAQGVHSLKGEPNVIDIRNIGLVGGIELQPIAGAPTQRAFGVFLDCWQQGLMVRSTGDTLALSPPLIAARSHIDQMVETLRGAIRRAA
jgi:beta-alanine--pyruvate transaminase